jgi:hypothetical protein
MDELSDCLHFVPEATENQAKRREIAPNAVRPAIFVNRILFCPESIRFGAERIASWQVSVWRGRLASPPFLPGRCCFRRRILVNAGRLRTGIAALS